MDCYEFEGKRIFLKYGIPIPFGEVASDRDSALEVFRSIRSPSVVKVQVLSGKRGKAGGILFAETEQELSSHVESLLSGEINEEKVRSLLIEERLDIASEFYLGITIDPLLKQPVILFSESGGMDIEEIVKMDPASLLKERAHEGMSKTDCIDLLFADEDLDPVKRGAIAEIFERLIKLFFEIDATTVEINPLVLCKNGRFVAADSKLVIDDSALFRQEKLGLVERPDESLDEQARLAKQYRLAFVALDEEGDIGTIAGGAGLALATMDTVRNYGGKPANFLDVGGGVSQEQMEMAVRLVLSKKGLRGVIINVFGGINNCEVMASGIEKGLLKGIIPRIVVKMRGHSQEEGWDILERNSIPVVKSGTTEDAVRLLLSLIRGDKFVSPG
ncbi:MAG: acetate--CoA ligase family protein [Synergistota bacterium]|nr:acetate--CoA ligase family protein [Synergistota bacterium]